MNSEVAPTLHYVDGIVLIRVQTEWYDIVSVVDVPDMVFGDGPVCEVELLPEVVEGLASFVDAVGVEYGLWILTFE